MKLHSGYYFGGLGGVGVFLLRLVAGVAMVLHGLPKMENPTGWMQGAPVPGFLQALAAFSEAGGGLALILGLLFPLALFGLMSTMFVAALSHIQRGQPFVGREGSWESSGLYFALFLTLFLLGPGRLALDALIFGRKRPLVGGDDLMRETSVSPHPTFAEPR